MANKKGGHTTIRNQKLFCMNCGTEQSVPYPIAIDMMTVMILGFDKLHKKCKPTWKQPEVNPTKSIEEKMDFWMRYGEHGTSSEVMFEHLSGRNLKKWDRKNHPCDPDDFRRCYVLLKTIPEWNNELHKLKTISPVWDKLVDHWAELTKMLEDSMSSKSGDAHEMYKLMEKLGC